MATAKKKTATTKKTATKTAVKKSSPAKSKSSPQSGTKKLTGKKSTKTDSKKITKAVKAQPAKNTKEISKTTKKSSTTETKPAKKLAPKKSDVFRCPISGIPVKPEKPNLSEKTIAKLKEILLEERVKHMAQSEELAQEAVDLIADREGGDTQFDEESGEGDSVAVERERTLFLSAEAMSTVEEIDLALERIETKTYGLCAPSQRRISVARLEALPWTTVCVDCKARSERPR